MFSCLFLCLFVFCFFLQIKTKEKVIINSEDILHQVISNGIMVMIYCQWYNLIRMEAKEGARFVVVSAGGFMVW